MHSRIGEIALLFACLVVAGAASLKLGQDANWDLQNYHFYNPWAWWQGRIFTWDIAGAQLQTYHNALLDLPFYAMLAASWPPRVVAVTLALPTGIAAYFLARLLRTLFADLPGTDRRLAIGTAFAIGVSPAIGVGVIGTTMNEWPLVALMMPGLCLLARALVEARGASMSRRALLGAGLLFGLATGFKLTAGTFAVGLCVAILLRGPYDRSALRRAFGEAFVFGLAVLAGTAVTLGPWAWALWTHFDSPIFPYGNQWIKSPWWGEYTVLTRRYGPHDLLEWLRFPFDLYNPREFFVSEVAYRDARIPVTYGLGLLATAAWLSMRLRGGAGLPAPGGAGVSRAWVLIIVFFVVSFLLWTEQHSVYRYLIVLDMLTGALIVSLLHRMLRPQLAAGVALFVAAALIATTQHADWWRVEFGPRWFDVNMPAVEKNAQVLITTEDPISFVLPYFPADARHLGVANSVNAPWRRTKLQYAVADAIRGHDGPQYQLTSPPGAGSLSLASHGLERDQASCREIRTNMAIAVLELCRLSRLPESARP